VVHVPLPDINGRLAILNVHTRDTPLEENLSLEDIAKITPGFSGADLKNLVNEASIVAAKNETDTVSKKDFDEARDKILLGKDRKIEMDPEDLKLTAYHEAGHTIVGLLVPGSDPIYKVTIIPKGSALGMSVSIPEKDQYSYSREKIMGTVAKALGGRVAEKLVFGSKKVTTGAENDIQKATQLCRNMVTKWGLSKLGPIQFSKDNSQETLNLVDQEVDCLMRSAYRKAKQILTKHRTTLDLMAEKLLEHETLDAEQIHEIMDHECEKEKETDSWSE
jgi:cell division protease FtsH